DVAALAHDGVVTVDGVELRLVDLDFAAANAEVFLRSPGFPRYLPPLVAARDRGVAMTTPVDLFMATLRPDQKVVAITGTKGKSTTTELLGRFLADAGIRAGVAGNLGIPVFADGWDSDAPVIVIEVSSYQASDLHQVPDIAVLTSLSQDHLSWHGGVERYVADKLRVVSNERGTAPVVIVSADEPGAIAAVESHNPVVVKSPPNLEGLPFQRVQNAALAAEALRQLTSGDVDASSMTDEQILAGAGATMPGRLDPCPADVERWQSVSFLDDTLGSNPSATAAGLRWARSTGRPTVVILGGTDRGVSVEPLRQEASAWNPDLLGAVTVADNGEDLATESGIAVVGEAASVADAVSHATSWLESRIEDTNQTESASRSEDMTGAASATAAGSSAPVEGIVLFSPAAPTPVRQGSWKDRSADFRAAISDLR
ncbi:MAG TPA: Mur ligase family protein, partial [Microthrixaceae bacterium]|nr:Mur ligase family protein [Microthrixaceae bacterium]